MNKEKEVEVVDSREAKVDLMEKVADLIFLCKIRENPNGRMMTETRINGKVVILIEEEVILILEVAFMVIVSGVVKRDIYLLNVDPLKVGKVTKFL